MPTPEATPPVTGFFGKSLSPYQGETEFKEYDKQGGYVFWKLQDVNGQQTWMPVKYFPPQKGKES